jgi:hypothetical protein
MTTPKDEPRRSRQDALRTRLTGEAYRLLSLIRGKIHESISVAASHELGKIEIRLLPSAAASSGDGPLPFSSYEARIVEKVRDLKIKFPHRPVLGKNIAHALGMEQPEPRLKNLIRNLVDRQVLEHDDTDGYSIAGEREEASE